MKTAWFLFVAAMVLTIPGRSKSQELTSFTASESTQQSLQLFQLPPLETGRFMLCWDLKSLLIQENIPLLTANSTMNRLLEDQYLTDKKAEIPKYPPSWLPKRQEYASDALNRLYEWIARQVQRLLSPKGMGIFILIEFWSFSTAPTKAVFFLNKFKTNIIIFF